jgi:hypothetical protein
MPTGARLATLAVALLVVTQAGCRSRQLANDQDQFRHALLGMYENQIMDNLIRAQNGLPFIQLDYTNITGTITDTGSGNIGFAPASTDTHVVDLIAKARSLTHTFTNTGTYGASGSRMSQLTVTANPVLDSAEVYNAYLAFLDKTGGLIRSCDPPPPGSAHMIRRCDGVYYWVPAQFRKEFLDLALKTTALRAQPLQAPTAFKTTIAGARLNADLENPALPAKHSLRLDFTDDVVEDIGTMKVSLTIRGTAMTLLFPVMPVVNPGPGEAVAPGEKTKRLDLSYTQRLEGTPANDPDALPMTPAELTTALRDKPVEITFKNSRPEAPSTDALLRSIFHENQLTRLYLMPRPPTPR